MELAQNTIISLQARVNELQNQLSLETGDSCVSPGQQKAFTSVVDTLGESLDLSRRENDDLRKYIDDVQEEFELERKQLQDEISNLQQRLANADNEIDAHLKVRCHELEGTQKVRESGISLYLAQI